MWQHFCNAQIKADNIFCYKTKHQMFANALTIRLLAFGPLIDSLNLNSCQV